MCVAHEHIAHIWDTLVAPVWPPKLQAEEEEEGRHSQHPAGLCSETQSAADGAPGAAPFACLLEHAASHETENIAPSATERAFTFLKKS